jgi:AraC-like DNA-binding protein
MPFDFNIYSSLLLLPFSTGVIYAILLFHRGRKDNTLSDYLLGLLILVNTVKVSFWMLGYAGWYDTHDGYTSFMFYFPFNNILLNGPILYFYFLSLTNSGFSFQKKHLKHIVLPALWILFILLKLSVDFLCYYPFPESVDFQFGTKGPLAELDKSLTATIISYLCFFYYVLLTLRQFRFYKKYISDHFSSTTQIDFRWLQNLLYAIIAGGTVMFCFIVTDNITDGLTYYQDWFSYLILGVFLYYISINGYSANPFKKEKLQYVLKEKEEKIDNKEIKEEEKLQISEDSTVLNNLKQKLEIHMKTLQPYLEPELTLNQLAKQINTNTTSLSKVINEGFNQNFNDYINAFRVYEFVARVNGGEHKKQTLIAIANDCGFNSKSTFNRSFKKVLNKTPIEYIKDLDN